MKFLIKDFYKRSFSMSKISLKSINFEIIITAGIACTMYVLFSFEQTKRLFHIDGDSLHWLFPTLLSWTLFQILVFAPLQELVFRYWLIHLWKKLNLTPIIVIVWSSILFSLSHFFLPLHILLATFLMGLLRWYDYYYNNSLVPIIISHMILWIIWLQMDLWAIW